MRLSEFHDLMRAHFGSARAATIARDHVFAALDGRTIDEAIDAGADPKAVWSLVWESFDVPQELRYGLPD